MQLPAGGSCNSGPTGWLTLDKAQLVEYFQR